MGSGAESQWPRPPLSERQRSVLRAVVLAYLGDAAPIGSASIAQSLAVNLSSASVRNTLAELGALGLVRQRHASAGRVPSERGLRLFVDELQGRDLLPAQEKRSIASSFADAEGDGAVHVASQLLSECSSQLGFVVAPRLDRVVLRHVSLVRLASDRLLVVLVSQAGVAYRRVITGDGGGDQAELDRIAAGLGERVAGRTLAEVRERLSQEARLLRRQAGRQLSRMLELGLRALASPEPTDADVVIETRLALLAQPEFQDPRRLREVLAAVETKERLLELLDKMLGEGNAVSVAFGEELEEPALHDCALVASRYGGPGAPLGVLGVIGPSRMNYARVIPLVRYLSEVITGKLCA
jgi:heat-inducible transcriptional repressor